MDLQDKVLKCVDCDSDFVFTVGQQIFFRDKQFRNEPKRCKRCKEKAKSAATFRPAPAARRPSFIETPATCSQCGKSTTVPFVPSQGRPVLRRDCFGGRRTDASV